jgi:hypothetical protein
MTTDDTRTYVPFSETRNYVDWDDEWAGLKARVEALEDEVEALQNPEPAPPAPGAEIADCSGYEPPCGDTICEKHYPPQPASGKRWTLHILDGELAAICNENCPEHIEVVPAADLDAADAARMDAEAELDALRDKLKEAKEDRDSITRHAMRIEARAKGLRDIVKRLDEAGSIASAQDIYAELIRASLAEKP